MDDSDDSDVILIDSDDNNDCRSQEGSSTINGDTTAINDINNTSNFSSFQQKKKTNHTIDMNSKDIECIDWDNSDVNKSCSSSSSSSSSGIPSPLFKTKSSSSVIHCPPSIIHTKSVSNNITVAKKKGLSNDNQDI